MARQSINLSEVLLNLMKEDSDNKKGLTGRDITKKLLSGNYLHYDGLSEALKPAFQKIQNRTGEMPRDEFNLFKHRVFAFLHLQEKKRKIQKIENEGAFTYRYDKQGDGDVGKSKEDSEPKMRGDSSRKYTKREEPLYKELQKYLNFDSIGSRRIDETKSSNRRGPEGNKWLYPDMIGVEFLNQNWETVVNNCIDGQIDKKIKLWSFEVKVDLIGSNVRYAFFQAVANSSWANLSYLVAQKIEGVEKELSMLSNHYGVGLILLSSKSEQGGYIKFPAREKTHLDWEIINRLVSENPDFKECIQNISNFHKKIDYNFWELNNE